MLDALRPLTTATDGWKPAFGEPSFLHRLGWILIGACAGLVAGHELTGLASTFGYLYLAYFLTRIVEHAWVHAQFWLSTAAFAVVAAISGMATFDQAPLTSLILVLVCKLAIRFGVGSRLHPTSVMLLFAPALGSSLLLDGPVSVALALVLTAAGLIELECLGRAPLRALAERTGCGWRLDSGELYRTHARGILRLRSRWETGPVLARFMVWSGPSATPFEGRVVVRVRDCERCRALQGPGAIELQRDIGDAKLTIATDGRSPLAERIASGALDAKLAAFCVLEHPLVVLDGGTIHCETRSRGADAAESLLRVGEAIEALACDAQRSPYR